MAAVKNAGDPGERGGGGQDRSDPEIGGQDGGAAGFQPRNDAGFFGSDGIQIGKGLEMGRGDGGDQRDMWPRKA